jgi:hypothetical protein
MTPTARIKELVPADEYTACQTDPGRFARGLKPLGASSSHSTSMLRAQVDAILTTNHLQEYLRIRREGTTKPGGSR